MAPRGLGFTAFCVILGWNQSVRAIQRGRHLTAGEHCPTNITGKPPKCELQAKGKTITDISAVKNIQSQDEYFLWAFAEKKVSYFPSVKSALNDNVSGSVAFVKAVEKFSRVIKWLRQDFESRLCFVTWINFSHLCQSFQILSCEVNLTCCWTSETFILDIEIATLQNDLRLKAAPNFWCFVDNKKYKGVCTSAMKLSDLLVQFICESAFSDMNFIKNKQKTTDWSTPFSQSCSKVHARLQWTGEQHAVQGFLMTDIYKDVTNVSVKHHVNVKLKYCTKNVKSDLFKMSKSYKCLRISTNVTVIHLKIFKFVLYIT